MNSKMRLIFTVASLLVLLAGNAFAQVFPSKPLTLISPFRAGGISDQYLRAFAQIASRHLGQPVVVDNQTGDGGTRGPGQMTRFTAPDGYVLSQLTITAFRWPHLTRVTWDPRTDFTYIIGIAAYGYGIVVKPDSPFKSLKDLIDYAKANPGRLAYGAPIPGGTAHLAMEDLGLKAGVKFKFQHYRNYPEARPALMDGQIMAYIDTTDWSTDLDAGKLRLLVTFGERRTRWNAPTAMELGIDMLSYSPFGIVGPKGMDPKVVKLLHDAFNRALDDPEYEKVLRQFDLVDWYRSSEDYAEWALDQFNFQRKLLERTIGLGRGFGN
jgi:tripartite-type tricarboxylate transporter receptor subunit TctC